MVFKFLTWLKSETTDNQFRDILKATEDDIKFNRIAFNKRTNQLQFIKICTRCAYVIIRTTGGSKWV